MTDVLTQRVLELVAATFDVPLEGVSVESSPETLPEWSSLGQLNLVLGLEQEFGVQIPPEQAFEMQSVEAIVSVLRRQIDG